MGERAYYVETINAALNHGLESHGHELDDVTGRVHAVSEVAKRYEAALSAVAALETILESDASRADSLMLELAAAEAARVNDNERLIAERDGTRVRVMELEQEVYALRHANDSYAVELRDLRWLLEQQNERIAALGRTPADRTETVGDLIALYRDKWEARCHFCGGPSFPWLTDDVTWAKVEPLLGQQQACFECFGAAWMMLGHSNGMPHLVVPQEGE